MPIAQTTTERQRLFNPKRYVRKDARTRILRALYGEAVDQVRNDKGKPYKGLSGHTRDPKTALSLKDARAVLSAYQEASGWPPETLAGMHKLLRSRKADEEKLAA